MFLIYVNDMTDTVCRWCEINEEDKKPIGLWLVTEWYKQDYWI